VDSQLNCAKTAELVELVVVLVFKSGAVRRGFSPQNKFSSRTQILTFEHIEMTEVISAETQVFVRYLSFVAYP